MKKSFFGFLGFVLLVVFFVAFFVQLVLAEVNVNINMGPPPIVVSEPAELVVIPNSGVYFVWGVNYDVFYYDGYWWSPRGDRWYKSRHYRGPWGVAQRKYIPAHLVRVPKNYRDVYKNERRINYKQWDKQRAVHEDRGHSQQRYKKSTGHGQKQNHDRKNNGRGGKKK